ncbi:MAG: DUF58 domain-containing protein [Acidobacteria bacterium]|nr:DUF58 domain-containing protein [Acidobacteriota bacterium]
MLRYFEALKSRFNPDSNSRRAGHVRRLFPYSFRITREGILYILFVFLLSLAAVNTSNNLLFIVLAVLLATIVVSGIISRNSLRQVSLSLQLPENVFVGEKVFIKVTLKNLKRFFPSFSIQVEDPELSLKQASQGFFRRWLHHGRKKDSGAEAPDRAMFRQSAYFPILQPRETCSELIVQSFPQRGLYCLQGFLISTRFPFGLFRRGEHIGAKGEILVYPLIQDISAFFQLLPFLPGHLEGRHVGPGENLFSIRKYQESESARIIDWKATAKTGDIMAREFAREEESKLCLILDTRMDSPAPESCEADFEKAVSLAASIAAHFLNDGAGMEFLTPNEHVPRGTGVQHLYRILRSLAVVQYERTSLAAAADYWGPNGFPGTRDLPAIRNIMSDKVFKIIISSKPRGSFPSAIWRSAHVVFFDEL